jgi:hypothetical protein
MTDWTAHDAEDFCRLIDAVNAISSAQVSGRQLSGRGTTVLVQRAVGQE